MPISKKVTFIEIHHQDDGKQSLFEDREAKVLRESKPVCKTCHENEDIHDRPRKPKRKHKFEKLEGNFLDLEVIFPSGNYISGTNIIYTGRKKEVVVEVKNVEMGNGACQWKN